MEKIGIITSDYGSTNQILSYIKYNNKKFYVLPNKKINLLIKNFNLKKKVIFSSYKEILDKTRIIIFGTGNTDFEKKYLFSSLINKKYSIAILDHFTNIKKRFFYKKKILKPNKIWVFDKYIYNTLSPKIRKKCILKKNFYLKYFKEYRLKHKISKKNQILFIDEPFEKLKKKYPQNFYSMKFFFQNFKKIKKFQKCNLILKIHPKQNKSTIKKYLKEIEIKNIKIVDKNLESLIISSKYIVGITSYALNLASQLGKKSYHCKLPNQRIKLISNRKILNFYNLLIKNEKH